MRNDNSIHEPGNVSCPGMKMMWYSPLLSKVSTAAILQKHASQSWYISLQSKSKCISPFCPPHLTIRRGVMGYDPNVFTILLGP